MASIPFIRPPEPEVNYQVGDIVEALCDHDIGDQRVRKWIEGVVVQVDPKLVAVQFNVNVYLTDGWMVPDRILWFPFTSANLRPVEDLNMNY